MFFGVCTQTGSNIYHLSCCSELERRCRTAEPNWWAKDCRALKHPRDILFILRQSGICCFELMTCVIQGALQVFGCIGFLLTRQVLELIKKNKTKKKLAAEYSAWGRRTVLQKIFWIMQLVLNFENAGRSLVENRGFDCFECLRLLVMNTLYAAMRSLLWGIIILQIIAATLSQRGCFSQNPSCCQNGCCTLQMH